MTTNAFSPAPSYTISGIGPYDVPHEYGVSSELEAAIVTGGIAVALDPTDYSVVPQGPATSGTVFLTPAAAAAHDGETLRISRDTTASQTWDWGTSTASSLEDQLDQLTRAIQDNETASVRGLQVAGTWRTSVAELELDTVLTYTAGQITSIAVGDTIRTLTEGFAYEVADSAATDHHLQTDGGIKLYVLPADDSSLNVMAFGAAGDGTTDDTAAIQLALDICAVNGGTVIFPTGIYPISSTLQSYEHVTLRGTGPGPNAYSPDKDTVEIRALTGVTTMLDLYTGATERRSSSVFNIRFNGNNTAARGIDISDTVSTVIHGCTFQSFTEGGAAIWGGGALYTTIQLNTFSGPFYALDSQDSYSSIPQVYYGINVGDFDKNIVSAHYGVRFEGILNFTNNDFEMQIKSRAAIDINSATHNSYCSIVGNYFEGTVDTGGELVAIRCEKMTGRIHDNRLYGDPGVGTAIKLDDSYNYSIDVRGNQITYWAVGIAAKPPGNGNALADRITIGPNNFTPASVTEYITGGPGDALNITSAANNGDDAQPAQYLQGTEHHLFSGGMYNGAVKHGPVTEISLRKGNFFKFTLIGTATVDTVRHTQPGHRFSVMAKHANSITLANSAFNLAVGTDYLLPVNAVLLFEVDPEGVVHEVGRTSALLSDAAPTLTDAVNPAGYVEIAPGKFVEYYQ